MEKKSRLSVSSHLMDPNWFSLLQDPSGNEVLVKFLEQGGSGRDFVAVLNQDVKVKTSDVVVVFAALESILHNVAKKSFELESSADATANKKFQQLALDITRNILEDHVRYLIPLKRTETDLKA